MTSALQKKKKETSQHRRCGAPASGTDTASPLQPRQRGCLRLVIFIVKQRAHARVTHCNAVGGAAARMSQRH